MNTKNIVIILGLILIAILIYFYFISDKKVEQSEVITQSSENNMIVQVKKDIVVSETNSQGGAMQSGTYEVFSPEKVSQSRDKKTVLFFRATWCPTCRALDENIRSNLSLIPEGVTILDVDYDKYVDLKKKYGVTYQHTLVQVDSEGKLVSKWAGSPTLATLISNIK